MEKYQIAIIIALLCLSAAVLFVPTVIYLVRRKVEKPSGGSGKKSVVSGLLLFSVCLFGAMWCLRYAVGYFSLISMEGDIITLTWWEEIIDSLFRALRTFSMEEEYGEYICAIKDMIAEIIPANHWSFFLCQAVAVAYASLLNLIAPVVSGAIILEIITSAFPKIKLRLLYLNFRRKKYFFSELNAASLALAKSIITNEKKEKPVLIFTDTYVDEEKEKEYELFLEAKQYGAICVRDDLAHVAKPRFGKREYYLMDENEFGNLQTLMGLVEDENIKFIRDSRIYLFVQSDAYVQIEKQVNLKLDGERKKKLLQPGNKPVIIPVNGFRNLVHNLLGDIPLYEPLVHKADPTKLNVTILGNGIIGTEAFLSTYWFGQMLISRQQDGKETMEDCELTVNVVSKDTEADFWAKIDYVNPEIQTTVEVLTKTESRPAGDLLAYNASGNKNNAYCKVRYIQTDVKIGGFWNGETEQTQKLLESDYFIVALGNDADNISVAEKLRRAIGKKHVEAQSEGAVSNAVIAYAVFDPELAETLNERKRYQTRKPDRSDIYMYAFGSLKQVYSCENVYMSKHTVLAEETANAYGKLQTHIEDNQRRAKGGENGNYNYWANLARAAHIKYKVFSLGWITQSVFSYYGDELKCHIDETKQGLDRYELLPSDYPKACDKVASDVYHREVIKGACQKYKRIAISNTDFADARYQSLKTELERKKHCLAWLEHRRWNAFTRTLGYQQIDPERILDVKNSQKDMELKLHSCLAEARRPSLESGDTYIYARFKPNGKVDEDSMFASYESEPLDYLDGASIARRNRDRAKMSGDYKVYDYYRYEFDNYLSTREVSELIPIAEDTIIANCQKGVYEGAIFFKECSEWHIPFDSLKKELEKLYYKLDPSKQEEEDLIKDCKSGKYKKGFEVFGEWFLLKEDAAKLPDPQRI